MKKRGRAKSTPIASSFLPTLYELNLYPLSVRYFRILEMPYSPSLFSLSRLSLEILIGRRDAHCNGITVNLVVRDSCREDLSQNKVLLTLIKLGYSDYNSRGHVFDRERFIIPTKRALVLAQASSSPFFFPFDYELST